VAPKRRGKLGNFKTIFKTMVSNFHLVKTYVINKLSTCATKILLSVLLSLPQRSYVILGSNLTLV